jgi:predicted phosphodiesterase
MGALQLRKLPAIFWFVLLVSCDSYFSYSPYEASLDRQFYNTTEKNLALINALDANESKPFKVALLSDPHYHFDKLSEAIHDINKKNDIAFVIVAGDLTEQGLMKEYIIFYEIMKKLKVPYLTLIGNHDYLSNGEKVYAQMFGKFNYTFVFNNVKFVLFDNVLWESEKEPDFTWFSEELRNDGRYDHTIPAAHIPPFDKQMTNYRDLYSQMMVKNNIGISIHGHEHDFSLWPTDEGVSYLTISSPQKRSYSELTVSPSSVTVEKIEF